MAQLFDELKRRNVFRAGMVYAIVGWLLLQVADVVLPTFGAPGWVMKVFTFLVVVGFPLVLVLAWAFELTPAGIRREKDVESAESITHITGRKLDFTIISLLALAVIFLLVDGYLLEPESAQAPAVNEPAPAAEPSAREKSIAVLPFVNMSSDPEQEYFSDGLSEEILNLLAKVPELKVIGRTSSFAFKGKNEDLRSIGQALGVNTVLEGSVRKSGDRVRITAQLIDVSNGAHLWSSTYDRTLTDIFAVQDNVASEILDALQVHVGAKPTRGRPTENTDAYALFLEAKSAMNRWDAESAEELLLQSIELDPGFAEAHEMLAYAYWEQWGNTRDAASATQNAEKAATRALAINPDLIFAQYLLESARSGANDLLAEIENLEAVFREEPNHGPASEILIYYVSFGGYFREALRIAERQVELDPLSPNVLLLYNQLLFAAGRKGEALAAVELADQLGSNFSKGNLAFFNWEEGRYEVSLAYREAYQRERGLPSGWIKDLHAGALDPVTGQAFLDRRIPEIVALAPADRAYEMQLVLDGWYLTYGFLDRHFEIIFERGISDHDLGDAEVLIFNSQIDRNSGFTADPRYLEIAEMVGLVELWEQRGPPDFCQKTGGEWVCE